MAGAAAAAAAVVGAGGERAAHALTRTHTHTHTHTRTHTRPIPPSPPPPSCTHASHHMTAAAAASSGAHGRRPRTRPLWHSLRSTARRSGRASRTCSRTRHVLAAPPSLRACVSRAAVRACPAVCVRPWVHACLGHRAFERVPRYARVPSGVAHLSCVSRAVPACLHVSLTCPVCHLPPCVGASVCVYECVGVRACFCGALLPWAAVWACLGHVDACSCAHPPPRRH